MNEVKKPQWNDLSGDDLEVSYTITETVTSLYG